MSDELPEGFAILLDLKMAEAIQTIQALKANREALRAYVRAHAQNGDEEAMRLIASTETTLQETFDAEGEATGHE